MLTPTLSSPSDLLNKLEREFWRALHHKHHLHKSDHFYNFCVTSNALKDYFFEWKKILPTNAGAEQKKSFYEVWNTVPELVAATEIANTMKHFVLRDRQGNPKMSQARVVRKARSTVVHVFLKPVAPSKQCVIETISASQSKRLRARDLSFMSLWTPSLAIGVSSCWPKEFRFGGNQQRSCTEQRRSACGRYVAALKFELADPSRKGDREHRRGFCRLCRADEFRVKPTYQRGSVGGRSVSRSQHESDHAMISKCL